MPRIQYLSQPYVMGFIDWLAANLNHPTKFAHAHVDRRSGKRESYIGIADAFLKYRWPHRGIRDVQAGDTLESNGQALELLQQMLRDAVSAGDDETACLAAIEVMRWGGVVNGNVKWLQENQEGLAALLRSTASCLSRGEYASAGQQGKYLRFNAGMTKVYSLLIDDFIIYDSRVAAALGWLVALYCADQGLSGLPDGLAFPWAPAKESDSSRNPKIRNPGLRTGLRFPRLRSGWSHAQWNLKSSWVLDEVLKKSGASPFTCDSDIPSLRRLEAALFMIGYDLGSGRAGDAVSGLAKPVLDGGRQWVECHTPTQRKRFFYRATQNGFELQDGKAFSRHLIGELLAELKLTFGEGVFPLANSATGVRQGTVGQGLGTVYYRVTEQKGNPPDTSKLAAILEDRGVFIRSHGPTGWALDMERLEVYLAGQAWDELTQNPLQVL